MADSKTIDGGGTGRFVSSITGLTINTPYSVKAYATNYVGTGYGNAQSFTLPAVTDIDGNNYHIVTISTQVWMAKNLKVTHYRNGDVIPNVSNSDAWESLTSGTYCEYGNSASMVAVYGRLYNLHAVIDRRGIAPAGRYVLTHAELRTLVDYLGGTAVAGGKLKEIGTLHWLSPNTGATNETGFTGLPGGRRWNHGPGFEYHDARENGYYWSTTEAAFFNLYAWYLKLSYNY